MVGVETNYSYYIEMYYESTKLSTGTAFLLKIEGETYLVTNKHNVTGRNPKTGKCISHHCGIPNSLKFFYTDQKSNKYGYIDIDLSDEDENKLWLEHRDYKGAIDVVILPFGKYALNLEAYSEEYITFYREPRIIDDVYVIGYPFGKIMSDNTPIWNKGSISTVYESNFDDLPCLLIDCRSRQGQSGSPVLLYNKLEIDVVESTAYINTDKKILLGVYSGRVNSESDLGLVWKIDIIREIVKSSKI